MLALVIVLAAAGTITINPAVVGSYMLYVLVGLAVAFFAFIFAAGGLTAEEKKRCAVIFVLFIFAAAFWGAFEQAPTSLNLFASDFTDRNIFGFEVPVLWFQSINSAFIILFAPVFAAIWVGMAKRNMTLSDPAKFTVGAHPRRNRLRNHGHPRERHRRQRRRFEGVGHVADDQLSVPDTR